ncbi:MAG: diadenylate cyclase CdaA [Bacteroidales bacterium]|nr:diadenylate cyclase CdaA [Bacteroidales bacterium]
MFNIVDIHVIDIIDILLVGLLVFYVYKLIRGTAAISIFLGIIILYIVWAVVKALNMSLLSEIMGQVLGVGVIAIIVLFQQEIRKFLLSLGSTYIINNEKLKIFSKLFGNRGAGMQLQALDEITEACRKMSETKTGALIVLARTSSMDFVVETGDVIDARISRRLIENLFFKNSPLHDGAMVIANDRIVAARCTLPISKNPNIPANYGMRHRAATGLSEETDACVVVVSEETGNISFVMDGHIKTMGSISELRIAIESSYRQN